MSTNALLFRLVVVGGALVILGVLAVGLLAPLTERRHDVSPDLGDSQATLIDPETLREDLEAQGMAVESLSRKGAIYEVRLASQRTIFVDAISGRQINLPEQRGSAMPRDQIRRKLVDRGYQEISPIVWQRGYYRTTARSPEGRRVSLTLDTYSGEVLESETQ